MKSNIDNIDRLDGELDHRYTLRASSSDEAMQFMI